MHTITLLQKPTLKNLMDIEHIITELNFQTGEDVQVNRTMTDSNSIRLSFGSEDYADFTREEAEFILQVAQSAHRLGIEDSKSLQELPH